MKISNNFKMMSRAFIGLLVVSVGLTACSKKYDNEPVKIAGISFVNASPVAGDYDIVVGNTKANKDGFTYGTKIDYLGLYPGIVGLGIARKGQTNFIASAQSSFQPGQAYTVFIIDGENKFFLKLEDDITAPEGNKTKVRFVNVSPDAPALSLGIKGQATDLATNKAYKASSDFVVLDAADKTTFEIKDFTSKAVKATLLDIKLEKGKVYTIYARGLNTPAGGEVSVARAAASADANAAPTDEFKFGASLFEHK